MQVMIMINGQWTSTLYCTWLIEWRTSIYLFSHLLIVIECSYLHTPVGSYMFLSYHTHYLNLVFVTDRLLSSSAWQTPLQHILLMRATSPHNYVCHNFTRVQALRFNNRTVTVLWITWLSSVYSHYDQTLKICSAIQMTSYITCIMHWLIQL